MLQLTESDLQELQRIVVRAHRVGKNALFVLDTDDDRLEALADAFFARLQGTRMSAIDLLVGTRWVCLRRLYVLPNANPVSLLLNNNDTIVTIVRDEA